MLLDQKRTKRIVQVAAIVTSIAFAGTIFVVMGLIFFGGGNSPEQDQINELKGIVDDRPQDPDAWQQLASAYIAGEQHQEAVAAAIRSVDLAPKSYRNVSTLALALQSAGNPQGAVDALEDFTARNPKNAEAFLQLGQSAAQIGRTNVARLAYQRFLELEPNSTQAEFVQAQLAELTGSPAAAPAQ